MSFIQLNYGEQCLQNSCQFKETCFIDTKKPPACFWIDLLKERCPEGLGDGIESLKSDCNLKPEDFLHDEIILNSNHHSQDHETCGYVPSPKPATCCKTPLKNTYHEQSQKTPSLFLPDDSINSTPNSRREDLKGVRIPSQTFCHDKQDNDSQTAYGDSSIPQHAHTPVGFTPTANVPTWSRRFTSTPDLLAEIMGHRTAHVSFLLPGINEDGSVEEWCDSMATPPLNAGKPSADGEKQVVEEALDEEGLPSSKRIVRVLFADGPREQSGEISAFSLGDRSMETDCELVDQGDGRDTATKLDPADCSMECLWVGSSFQQDEKAKDTDNPLKAAITKPCGDRNSNPDEGAVECESPSKLVSTPVAHACDTYSSLKSSFLASSPWARNTLSPSVHFQALAQSTPKPLSHGNNENPTTASVDSTSFNNLQTNQCLIKGNDMSLPRDFARDGSVPFRSPSPSCVEALVQASCDVPRNAGRANSQLDASDMGFGSPSQSFELAMARAMDNLCSGVERDSRTSGLGSSLSGSPSSALLQSCLASSPKTRTTQNTGFTKPTNAFTANQNRENPSCGLSTGPAEDCMVVRRRSFGKVAGPRRSLKPTRFSYPSASQIIRADKRHHNTRRDDANNITTTITDEETVQTLEAKSNGISKADSEDEIPAAKRLKAEKVETELPPRKRRPVANGTADGSIISAHFSADQGNGSNSAERTGRKRRYSASSRTISEEVIGTPVGKTNQESNVLGTPVSGVSVLPRNVNCSQSAANLVNMDALSQFPIESVSFFPSTNSASCSISPVPSAVLQERVGDAFELCCEGNKVNGCSESASVTSPSYDQVAKQDREGNRTRRLTLRTEQKEGAAVDLTEGTIRDTSAVDLTEGSIRDTSAVDMTEGTIRDTSAVDMTEGTIKDTSAVDMTEGTIRDTSAVDMTEGSIRDTSAVDMTEGTIRDTSAVDMTEGIIRDTSAVDMTEGSIRDTSAVDMTEGSIRDTSAVDMTEGTIRDTSAVDLTEGTIRDTSAVDMTEGSTRVHTAGDNRIEMSEEAPTGAQALVEQVDSSCTVATSNSTYQESNKKYGGMLSSASSNESVISTSIKPTVPKGQTQETEPNSLLEICSHVTASESVENCGVPEFEGFQTASGKKVEISSQALTIARATLDEIDRSFRLHDSQSEISKDSLGITKHDHGCEFGGSRRTLAPNGSFAISGDAQGQIETFQMKTDAIQLVKDESLTCTDEQQQPQPTLYDICAASCKQVHVSDSWVNKVGQAPSKFDEEHLVTRARETTKEDVLSSNTRNGLDALKQAAHGQKASSVDHVLCFSRQSELGPTQHEVPQSGLCYRKVASSQGGEERVTPLDKDMSKEVTLLDELMESSDTTYSSRLMTSNVSVTNAESTLERTNGGSTKHVVDDSLLEELLSDCARKKLVSVDAIIRGENNETSINDFAEGQDPNFHPRAPAIEDDVVDKSDVVTRNFVAHSIDQQMTDHRAVNPLDLNSFCAASGKSELSLNKANVLQKENYSYRNCKPCLTVVGHSSEVQEVTVHSEARGADKIAVNLSGVGGFETTSGKAVSVSKDVQNFEKRHINTIEEQRILGNESQMTEGHLASLKFETITVKNKIVLEKPLESQKSVMGGTEDYITGEVLLNKEEPSSSHFRLSTFQTASQKTVSASRKAMHCTARAIRATNEEQHVSESNEIGACGFSGNFVVETAGGKDVDMSREALEKKATVMRQIDQSLKKDENVSELPEHHSSAGGFSGFHTAGGKNVQVSKEALDKGAAIMREIDRSLHNNGNESELKTKGSCGGFSGFQTAGGKHVQVSKEALDKGAAIMREIDRSLDNHGKESELKTKGSCGGFPGFQTAGGKNVQLSKEALDKGAAIMREIDRSLDNNGKESELKTKGSCGGFSGFQTAGGKNVQLSKEALDKGATIMREIDRSLDNHGKESELKTNGSCGGFSGFQTAGGKTVQVSKEALDKGAAIMREIDRFLDNSGKESELKTKGSCGFSGFQTAGGKNVQLSKEALDKGAAIMREIDRSLDNSGKESELKTKGSCGFSGFQTAGGKNVQLSKEALDKGASIMREIDRSLDNHGKESELKTNGSCGGFSGFQTAGGKNVQVSKEALDKGAAIMREIDRSLDNHGKESKLKTNDLCGGFSGFQTAGGKNVQVSKEALDKGAAIMREIDRVLDNDGKESKLKTKGSCGGFSGFQTAGGKNVELSKETLDNRTVIVREIDRSLDNDITVNKWDMSGSCGFSDFQTAGGKNVQVSREALEKEKSIIRQSSFHTGEWKTEKQTYATHKKSRTEMSAIDNELQSPSLGNEAFGTHLAKSLNLSEGVLRRLYKRSNFLHKKIDHDRASREKQKSEMIGFEGFELELPEKALATVNVLSQELDKSYTENSAYGNKFQCIVTDTKERRKTQETLHSPVHVVESQARVEPVLVESCRVACDEEVSREIQESFEALMADESFMDVSEHLQDKNTDAKVNRGCVSTPRRSPLKDVHDGKRTGPSFLKHRITRRYSTPLLCCEDMFGQNQTQTRKGLNPVRTTPSAVLHDRRVRFHTALIPRLTNAEKEAGECSPRNFGGAEPLKPLHAVNPGCFTNTKMSSPATSTPLNSIIKRRPSSGPTPHFVTPYRRQTSTNELSPLTRCSASRPSVAASSRIEDPDEGAPSTKKPKISDPSDAESDNQCENSKTNCTVKPQLCSLSQLRRSGCRMTLREYVGNGSPEHYSTEELIKLDVSIEVLSVTSSGAASFRFSGNKHFSEAVLSRNGGVRTEDGGMLHVGTDGNVGLKEIFRAFLSTPGVDGQLINQHWVTNHYRWIVWKLAAMEVAFPCQFAGRCLTPEWVLCQLKYRYDREVDHSNRSALKKIMELDDVSSRTMVLCVSNVTSVGSQCQEGQDEDKRNQAVAKPSEDRNIIEVTDGWYGIGAILDKPLTRLLKNGKIFVGQKLCTYGAELVGSEQACSPLEAPSSLMLQLHANSTRRARWDSKLGFHCHPHAFPLPLASLFGDGGLTGCVDVIVVRQYPVQWMEKLPDGTNCFRNSRLEEREAKKFEQNRHQRREKLFLKLQEEFEKECWKPETGKRRSSVVRRRRRTFSSPDLKDLYDGREIYEVLAEAPDPEAVKECLDERQVQLLEEYSRSLQEERRAELQNRFERVWKEQEDQHHHQRNVVPLLKVRIVDYLPRMSPSATDERNAVLSIWRPSEEVISQLSEGSRLRIYNLAACGLRYRRGSELQLSVTRTTKYRVLPSDPDLRSLVYSPRQAISFDQLKSKLMRPFSEVDLVGLVVFCSPLSSYSHSSTQTVFVADEESNLVALKFWGGLKAFAVEDQVKPLSFICCSNLELRPDDRLPCPTLCFSDLSSLAVRPRLPHLRAALDNMHCRITNVEVFMVQIQKKLDAALRPNRSSPLPEVKVTTVRVYGSSPDSTSLIFGGKESYDHKVPANSTTKLQDNRASESTECSRSISCPGQSVGVALAAPTAPASPGVGVRTKSKQSKRKLLDSYPEPPPLSPLTVSISANARREFKRPRRLDSVTSERNEH